jgi:sugar lactone lactonase YvrE
VIKLLSFSATMLTLSWNSTGVTVAGNGSMGTGATQFSSPMGLALDSSNTLYIGDLNNSRVQKWPMGAWAGITVAGLASGAANTTANSLNQVGGIAIDSAGGLYVSDIFNCRIEYWPNGASSGTMVAGTGKNIVPF